MADRQRLFETFPWPKWAMHDARYRRLTELDLFLAGHAYNHLEHPFCDEHESNGEFISIYKRRPSAIYNLPGLVAKTTSRKLFAGRHAPTLQHDTNRSFLDNVKRLCIEAKTSMHMPFVARGGSIGAIALTFKVFGENDQAFVKCEPWESRWCKPRFDKLGDLSFLRIAYPAPGADFVREGFYMDNKGESITPALRYWRVVDHELNREVNYLPMAENIFDPNDPETFKELVIGDEEEDVIVHDLGKVQAYWFVNMSGGTAIDGACTWEDAIPMSLCIDWLLSSTNRGAIYNSSPLLVTIGNQINKDEEGSGSSPAVILRMAGGFKDEGGATQLAGDAKLLEVAGDGLEQARELVKFMRKLGLESIGAQRKDVDEVGDLITGKAMELLDEDFNDMMMELRNAYGEEGFLKFVKLLCTVAKRANHPLMRNIQESEIDGLYLTWPRVFTPTPAETAQLVQGMSQAVGTPATEGKPGTPQLIDEKDARKYVYTHLGIEEETANRNDHQEKIDSRLDGIDDKDADQIEPPQES